MKEGWVKEKLVNVSSIQTGKHDANHSVLNGKYRFYTCAFDHLLCDTYRFEGECLILPGNGVNVGEVFYYNGKFDAYQRTYVINKINIYPKYLYYHLKFSWRDVNLNKQFGSATNFLKIGNFKDYDVRYPKSLPEQKQIVAILDQAFAAIDQAKANIEKNIENAKELFQSKLNEIFSQSGEGSAEGADKWEKKTLGEVCENLDSKRVPITKSKRIEGEIPYYGASGIVDYVENYLFDEELLLVSEDGANLLARTYPIAFSISGKTWVNNHAHVLRFKNMTSQIFIEYYLNSIKLDDYISGMAQPKLNQKKLNSIAVPFPTLDIQEKIIFFLQRLSDYKSNLIESYEHKISSLEELKKSILQKAFAGELTSPERTK